MPKSSALVAACFALLLASSGVDAASAQVAWTPFQPASRVVDLAGPRSDGRLAVAMGGGIQLFGGPGLTPFTSPTGRGAYVPSAGEPYLTMTTNIRLPKRHCSFHRDEVFAIGDDPDRITRIRRSGAASQFAALPTSPFPSAITFDRVGGFGHRLLTVGVVDGQSVLYAIDCRGRIAELPRRGPVVEGGIEVAPRSFGRFGGRLIGLDEIHGGVYAFKRDGSATTVAVPNLPTGGDIGVESLGFVPRLRASGAAFLADRGVPGAPHPGTDSILRLTAGELSSAGVRAGDLLIATEGGAETIAIRCRRGKPCAVLPVGQGPAVTHAEGHIAFLGIKPAQRSKKKR
jgi:hypothetical protein